MSDVFDNGDVVRVFGTFTSTGGTAVDPTAVRMRYRAPGSTLVTLTYGGSTRVVKSGTGNYYVDIQANKRGVWRYRFDSSGAGKAAEEKQFTVRPGLI